MKIKALITALVLGSSSLALASPSWSGGVQVTTSSRYGHGPVVRDHRGWDQAPIVQLGLDEAPAPVAPIAQPDGRWMELGIRSTSGRRWEQIAIPADMAALCQFKLIAQSGKTRIGRIVIEFEDGSRQFVRGVTLDQRYPVYTFTALGGGRRVARILVEGTSAYGSSYSVLAV